MKVILPVAGKGERMRPYTNNLPKCLLPVGGKTIIDWIVADTLPLKATETIFITGYKAEVVEESSLESSLESILSAYSQAFSIFPLYITS